MGFDVTITRPDGEPLGDLAYVQSVLGSVFPGVVFSLAPAGPERLRHAESSGLNYPEILRELIAKSPPRYEAEYEGEGFSIQFYFNVSEPIESVGAVLYGDLAVAEPQFAGLERYGWIGSHP